MTSGEGPFMFGLFVILISIAVFGLWLVVLFVPAFVIFWIAVAIAIIGLAFLIWGMIQ